MDTDLTRNHPLDAITVTFHIITEFTKYTRNPQVDKQTILTLIIFTTEQIYHRY